MATATGSSVKYISGHPDLPGPPSNPPTFDVPPRPEPIPGNPEWVSPLDTTVDTGTVPGTVGGGS